MTAPLSVLQALAVTAELTGTQLSESGARVMASDLAGYPEIQVLGALSRCRKELKGRLTVADVISRLDDGRPDAQEAWASLPFDEGSTVVWTEEMAGAWGVALPLLEEGDKVGARMAFIESYKTRMQKARDAGNPVKWTVSFGHDPHVRQAAIDEAVSKGRLGHERALQLGYTPGAHPQVAGFIADTVKKLTK